MLNPILNTMKVLAEREVVGIQLLRLFVVKFPRWVTKTIVWVSFVIPFLFSFNFSNYRPFTPCYTQCEWFPCRSKYLTAGVFVMSLFVFVLQNPAASLGVEEDDQSFEEEKKDTSDSRLDSVHHAHCLLTCFVLQNPTAPQLGMEEDDHSFKDVKRTQGICVCKLCTMLMNCVFTRFFSPESSGSTAWHGGRQLILWRGKKDTSDSCLFCVHVAN